MYIENILLLLFPAYGTLQEFLPPSQLSLILNYVSPVVVDSYYSQILFNHIHPPFYWPPSFSVGFQDIASF